MADPIRDGTSTQAVYANGEVNQQDVNKISGHLGERAELENTETRHAETSSGPRCDLQVPFDDLGPTMLLVQCMLAESPTWPFPRAHVRAPCVFGPMTFSQQREHRGFSRMLLYKESGAARPGWSPSWPPPSRGCNLRGATYGVQPMGCNL